MLAETEQMIPDCRKRLEAAYQELKQLTKDVSGMSDATEEVTAAEAVLTEVQVGN